MTPMLEPVGAHMGLLSGRATILTWFICNNASKCFSGHQ